MSTITLIVCAAPLARRTQDIVDHLHQEGHTVHVCPTHTAAGEWDVTPSAEIPRQPDALIACPLTFNTLSAWATGLNNSRALGALNDALGYHTPVLAVPMLAERLTTHPAYTGHINRLASAGVAFLSLLSGQIATTPPGVASGDGTRLTLAFSPDWPARWIRGIRNTPVE